MIGQIYEVGNPEEAKKLVEVGVDHIGVFVGKGKFPREIGYKEANESFKSLPKNTTRVALTLAEDLDEIREVIKNVKFDILHIGTLLEKLFPQDIKQLK